MTVTEPAVPSTAVALYDVLDRLGSLGPTGDPLVCAALLLAVSTVKDLALREVAAVDADASHADAARRGRPAVRGGAGAASGGLHLDARA